MPRAEFVEVDGRRLFTLHYRPPRTLGSRIALLPPLGEEMNKSRRLLALVGEALQARHCELAVVDAEGTGDSEGLFEDATFESWERGFSAAFKQLLGTVDVILCVRAGALLADGVAARLAQTSLRAVALQPVLRGAAYLQQMMRVRLMADKLAGGNETADELRATWSRGETVDLSGYAISPTLARGLQAAETVFAGYDDVAVLECRAADKTTPSAAVGNFVEGLVDAGTPTRAEVIAAESFWSSQEISAPPAVVAALVECCTAESHRV